MRRCFGLVCVLSLLAVLFSSPAMSAVKPVSSSQVVHGGVEPEPGITTPEPQCSPGQGYPLIVNGQMHCGVSGYRVAVPGGERVMIGVRALTEALGGSVTLDWYTVQGPGSSLITYVWGANRHFLFKLRAGSNRLWRWRLDESGEEIELPEVLLDAPTVIRDGTTYLPLRAAVEALGGAILSHEPYVAVRYQDSLQEQDLAVAEKLVPGVREALAGRLVTPDDVYFLGDLQLYREASLAAGDPTWASHNPVAYIRFTVLHESVRLGRSLTPADYQTPSVVGTVSAILGKVFSWEEIQEIGRHGEDSIDIVAAKWGWNEYGRDPVTGEWMDFRDYNDLHRTADNLNGPDRMFTVTDKSLVIIHYVPSEGKASLIRPWISLSRFKENMPFYRQVVTLSRWREPSVSVPFTRMQGNLEAYLREVEAGRMTLEEYRALIRPVRVATSTNGGFTQAARQSMDKGTVDYVGLNMRQQIIGGRFPVPPKEER